MKIEKDEILDGDFNEGLAKGDPNDGKRFDKIGIGIAKWSFISGTILLILGFISGAHIGIIFIGMYYTGGAFIVNLLYFFYLLIKAGSSKKPKPYLITAVIMLINLPIAILYFFIVIEYMGV